MDAYVVHKGKNGGKVASNKQPKRKKATTKSTTTKRKKSKRNTTYYVLESHPNYNEDITNILKEMGDIEGAKGLRVKSRAYGRAVRALSNHSTRVKSGKEAQKLDGIGKKIGLKIDEILKTGKLKKVETLNNDEKITALRLINKIHGFGPVQAKKLVYDEDVRTIDDLKALIKEDKFTPSSTQQIGIKYFEEFNIRIPRNEVEQLEKNVLSSFVDVDSKLEGVICGSYRRGAENSGDIDVLIRHPDYTVAKKGKSKLISQLVSHLHSKGFLTDDLSSGASKYMGVCILKNEEGKEEDLIIHRRIDIMLIPYENYYPALLYFTGSDFFNTQMRTIALERGFTLNEYEIKPIGETGEAGDPIPVESEEDIFALLSLEYKTPAERNL